MKHLLPTLLVFLTATPSLAQSIPPTTYHVILDKPQTQTLRVRVELRGLPENPGGDGAIDLLLPTWRPGRYVENDHAGTVRWLRATAPRDAVLRVTKIDKATWRVFTEGRDAIDVEYEIYANALNTRTRHVDDTHAFLDGSAIFVLPEGRRDAPCIVDLDAPPAWRVACGLPAVSERDPSVLSAPNYDVLVDSPIEVGVHQRDRFFVEGVPHEIVVWFSGPTAEIDFERMKTDFAKIVNAQRAIFITDDNPTGMHYDRYVFLIHAGPGLGGGTEHLNSTVMHTRTATFRKNSAYRGFLALVSHEMFHTWNVKNFRPRGITPYDYSGPNYTTLLWFVEGCTSYYDDLILARAGLITFDDEIDRLSASINSVRNSPGARVQSLADSSFDAWIKFNTSTPDTVNSTINFYTKGALASFLLDCTIRKATDNERSLDDVMREMNTRFAGAPRGYTEDDLKNVCEEIAGVPLDRFFEDAIHGTGELWFDEVVDALGLELAFVPNEPEDDDKTNDTANASAGDDDDDRPAPKPVRDADGFLLRPYLGIDTRTDEQGRCIVRSVRTDAPAYEAGILPGDELLALNDTRITEEDDPTTLAARLRPGQRVTIELSRAGLLRTIECLVGSKRDGRWELRVREGGGVVPGWVGVGG